MAHGQLGDVTCIAGVDYQTLQKRVETLERDADVGAAMVAFTFSRRQLAEKLAAYKEFKDGSSLLDDALRACDGDARDYNLQVIQHSNVVANLEFAQSVRPTILEMKRRLALPRCKP